jgi:hypothetical protein
MASGAPSLETRLRDEEIKVVRLKQTRGGIEDAAQTTELARRCDADWVVVDGYHFASDYIARLRIRFACSGARRHRDAFQSDADTSVDQNLHANEARRMHIKETTLLTRVFCWHTLSLCCARIRSWR